MRIAIAYLHPLALGKATQLSEQLQLPLLNYKSSPDFTDICSNSWDFILAYNDQDQLALYAINEPKVKPIVVDFLHGKVGYRCQHGGGRQQSLARAVGLHKNKDLTILDVTAGLGTDAYILSHLGAKVVMLERNPIIAALLYDGLQRAQTHIQNNNISLQFDQRDSIDYMLSLSVDNYPDVIYLDPMFPSSKNSALVKKEMRFLKKIVGKDEDSSELLKIALKIARRRIVIKRPKLAEIISGPEPQLQMLGQSNRFDIYLVNH